MGKWNNVKFDRWTPINPHTLPYRIYKSYYNDLMGLVTSFESAKANINAVYNAIKSNTDISVDEICRICKISRATAARAIAWLKENEYIHRTTANQYGSWIILK